MLLSTYSLAKEVANEQPDILVIEAPDAKKIGFKNQTFDKAPT